jgi:Stress responsive A/B Barrel Domain
MDGRYAAVFLSCADGGVGMSMLRRFEIYSVDPKAPQDKVATMRASMRNAQRHIPEVLHSAVGDNKSEVALHFVWEHAYESSESYKRYMIHPFHANIYDRYLLNDSPERLVTNNPYDVGLLGYSCEKPIYFLKNGAARRLVLLRVAQGQEKFVRALTEKVRAGNPRMILSVFAENTFATRWLDGVTQMLEQTTYSHIWEQGYDSLENAAAAGNDWRASAGAAIEKSIELWYELDAGYEGG